MNLERTAVALVLGLALIFGVAIAGCEASTQVEIEKSAELGREGHAERIENLAHWQDAAPEAAADGGAPELDAAGDVVAIPGCTPGGLYEGPTGLTPCP